MFGFLTIWAMLKPDCGSSSAFKLLKVSDYKVQTAPGELWRFDYLAVGTGNQLTVNGALVRGAQLPIRSPPSSVIERTEKPQPTARRCGSTSSSGVIN